jgi:SAM-dependent methyltransferase
MSKHFNERYVTGNLPWNINRPDFNLISTVRDYGIGPCKALDIGCGTGDNALWLARQGFAVTGIDSAEKAVDLALQKSEKNKLQADFFVRDILHDEIPGNPYDFAFDRGCFHTYGKKRQRRAFAKNVHTLLRKGGHWLSLIGSFDDGRLDIGPPKRTALEVIEAVEPQFEILQLKKGQFDSNDPVPSKIWVCLMVRR